ncbi:prepilin-type N-terminal cleavage/methylation domain-containing protein [Patescibacteria group bacterium]|nr:prepilin-type N-terminal cleavage/methylation domain-containing protein [Patescibacteria group bacterium]
MKKLPKHFRKSLQKGLSLIELLIVIMILGVLIFISVFAINPLDQLRKSSDAQKRSDLAQIRQALDTYYNDHNCYPTQDQNIPFGQEWEENGVVYMKEVPQDKGCTGASPRCYIYQTDSSSSCPQWNVIYAKLEMTRNQLSSKSTTCFYVPDSPEPTKALTSYRCETCPVYSMCGTMTAKYDYCIVSGSVDCTSITSVPTPILLPTSTPVPTNIPTPTVIVPPPTSVPTPTIGPCPGGNYYACTSSPQRCNDIGTDPTGLCLIHGGSNVCYCERSCSNVCPGG